jgi:hypothetical protein
MIITNTDSFGGDLWTPLFEVMAKPGIDNIRIVSGYVGAETIAFFTSRIPNAGNAEIKILVGMAFREGLSPKTYTALRFLHGALKSHGKTKGNNSGVYIYFADASTKSRERGIHAKGYLINSGQDRQLYLGSSNFSFSGLNRKGNIELNISESNGAFALEFERFFDDFFTTGNAAPIDVIEHFPLRGQASALRKKNKGVLARVTKPVDFKSNPYVDLDLARNIESQQKSNLNTCFGRGRWARATNKVNPREWYEVEIISNNPTTSNANYPKGDFWITTSDGYRFEARTQGDYFKNLRSKVDLKTLGLWIKGAILEDSGCLSDDPQELVTLETFEKYGNSILRLYRISKNEYVAHFPRVTTDL